MTFVAKICTISERGDSAMHDIRKIIINLLGAEKSSILVPQVTGRVDKHENRYYRTTTDRSGLPRDIRSPNDCAQLYIMLYDGCPNRIFRVIRLWPASPYCPRYRDRDLQRTSPTPLVSVAIMSFAAATIPARPGRLVYFLLFSILVPGGFCIYYDNIVSAFLQYRIKIISLLDTKHTHECILT